MTDQKILMEEWNEDDFSKDADEEKRAKFMNNRRVLFTYKTHINKIELEEFFKHVTKGQIKKDFPFWRAAHENGLNDPKTPYEHTHVVVDFGKPFQSTNCRIFDFNEIHPHLRFIMNEQHFGRAKRYLSKEDPENADLKDQNSYVKMIWACTDRKEALEKYVRTPSEVMGVNLLFSLKPKDNSHLRGKTLTLRPWQEKLLNMIDHTDNDRKIIWIRDLMGGAGKTAFIKYCLANDPVGYAFMKGGGSGMYHASTYVQNLLESGWSGRVMFVDFVRDNQDHKFYEVLEAIRDGMMSSSKYQGKPLLFDNQCMIVMANWWPDVNRLSGDRWELYSLDKSANGVHDLVPITLRNIGHQFRIAIPAECF